MSKQPIKEDFQSKEEQAERSARRRGMAPELGEPDEPQIAVEEDGLNVPENPEEEHEDTGLEEEGETTED